LAIKAEEVDLAAITRHVVHNHTAVSEDHTISSVIAPSEQPYIVKGDPARLEQIIANLVENAIKYSPFGGPVTISLCRQTGSGIGEQIEVCVEDKGIGVPLDAQPHLFERFYRAPGVDGSKPRGIGLGLYIVAQVLQLHGGYIHVESSGIFGEGSRFIFTLPALLQPTEVPRMAPVEQNNA
jgi:signal transduction histidine kinase